MTRYRLYLRSHVRREAVSQGKSSHAATEPTAPGQEQRPSMVFDDHRYSYVISGCEEFDAENDAAALAIAREIFNAASDVCDAFELWDGTRHIDQSRMATLQTTALVAHRQEHIVRTEEALLNSHGAIARSRRLLERFNEIRKASAANPASAASKP
jgi:hypothetical protein